MAEAGLSSDDRDLVARFLRTRDDSAFRAIYRRHTPMLYRVAWRMAGNADRAAEIVQDTWIRAIENLAAFRWQSSLTTWLVGIAINCAREEARRAQASASAADSIREPAARAPAIAERMDLENAIASLAPGFREILLLHDVEGLTHEEIALALGIEAGTSRSQLARARAALRECLQQGMRRSNG